MGNQTAAFSGKPAPASISRVQCPPGIASLAALVTAAMLLVGCGKGNGPKITGSRSGAPVSLACSWKPGYTYHLRLDTEIITETEGADAQDDGRHRVTFGQEYIIRVTNSLRGSNLDLEVEIASVEMERAKNEAVALSYNSDQGGEYIDDMGYAPVLKKLIGGRLRFSVTPSGKVVKFEGIPEWLNNALGPKANTSRAATSPRVKTVIRQTSTNSPAGPPAFEVLSEDVATGRVPFVPGPPPANVLGAASFTNRFFTAAPGVPSRPAPSPSGAADTVARTLRGFFNTDLFRTLLEFHFLPSAEVRVGDEWKEQGDTPITGRSTRVRYDAQCKFSGWQQHGGTNCARIDALGKVEAKMPAAKSSRKDRKSGMDGTVWVNTELAFPATTVLDKESVLPGDTNTRMVGTNSVTTTSGPKYARQHVNITLLKAIPPDEAPAASADASP